VNDKKKFKADLKHLRVAESENEPLKEEVKER